MPHVVTHGMAVCMCVCQSVRQAWCGNKLSAIARTTLAEIENSSRIRHLPQYDNRPYPRTPSHGARDANALTCGAVCRIPKTMNHIYESAFSTGRVSRGRNAPRLGECALQEWPSYTGGVERCCMLLTFACVRCKAWAWEMRAVRLVRLVFVQGVYGALRSTYIGALLGVIGMYAFWRMDDG